MAETWYARSDAGAACGPGTRRALSATAGASAATQGINLARHTWNRVEAARSIGAGNWQVTFWVTTTTGGGAGTLTVNVRVARMNASCVEQEEILNQNVEVVKSATATQYQTPAVDPGQIAFAAGDILLVEVEQTAGNRAVTLRFNGAASGDAETRLIHPDGFSPPPEGGSETTLAVSTDGDGTKHGIGGAETTLSISTDGSGSKVASGGSEATVAVSADGGGERPTPQGGSEATVTVASDGGGAKHGAGGSETILSVAVDAGGFKVTFSGSDTQLSISADGGGAPVGGIPEGGSETTVAIASTGGGHRPGQGGGQGQGGGRHPVAWRRMRGM